MKKRTKQSVKTRTVDLAREGSRVRGGALNSYPRLTGPTQGDIIKTS